jgi:hypothetical protein
MVLDVDLLLYSTMIAVWAIAWVCLMPDDNGITYRPAVWAENHLPHWLYKPLIGCEKCHAGQVALWLFFFLTDEANPINYVCGAGYNPLLHLYFIAQTIVITTILSAWVARLRQ